MMTEGQRASQAKYRQANAEKISARQKERRQAKAEQIRKAAKAYREANPDKVKAGQKAYRQTNPDRVRATKKRYRENHAEQIRITDRARRKANPQQNRDNRRKRRARVRGSEIKVVLKRDWERLCARYQNRCAYCNQDAPLTVEHVIPLVRGGRHAIGNLLPVCHPCNSSKGTKLLVEWRRAA